MPEFSAIAESLRRCLKKGSEELAGSFEAVLGHFASGRAGDCSRRALLSLVGRILSVDGKISAERLEIFHRLMIETHSEEEARERMADLQEAKPLSPEEELAALLELPESERRDILRFLVELAAAVGGSDAQFAELAELSGKLDLPTVDFAQLQRESMVKADRRRKLLRSGAGVLAALLVLAVFILTATLLRSVVFGLLAAYLLLPLEKHFERRLIARRGVGYFLMRCFDAIFAPLVKLSSMVMRRATEHDDEAADRRFTRRCIDQAVAQTVLVFIVAVTVIFGVLWGLTDRYMSSLSSRVSRWSHQTGAMAVEAVVAAPEKTAPSGTEPGIPAVSEEDSELVTSVQLFLDQVRERFARLPLVRNWLDKVEMLLHDSDAQTELFGALLKRSGGLFSFTANLLGSIGALLADVLLTFFFGLLFLVKLAEFCRRDESSGRKSEYLVRTVLNGSWLPGAGDETIVEANRIIGGILERMRVWARGYITLMLVDATTYCTLFFLLDVPYFPLLGLLAGCGILLPYVGPILSASVTILVTLAAGGSTGVQLLGIIVCYLVYNGIIEQFILYPAVIGESLGLTTLETIVVVLLGAIFAGIPGMILALPAASVLKFLVPQIYRCIGRRA